MIGDKKIAETPLMKQFFATKAQYPEALLLYRVGDFYETFGEDAVKASKILGIVLTKRANGSGTYIELAGFPHHAIDNYLPKLVRAGYKVAVCDQLEDPKLTKKIVKRGVTELVTPGVAYNEQLLPQKENNFLASVYFYKEKAGIAFLDISTGTFKIAEGDMDYIEMLISNYAPHEVLVQKGFEKGFRERFFTSHATNIYISTIDQWAFVYESSYLKLTKQFSIDSLKGFGVEDFKLGITAAGAILFYLENTQQASSEYCPTRGLSHLCSISRIDRGDFMWMDRFTARNLEILAPLSAEGISLLNVLDKCSTPMGGRLLRSWIAMPSKSLEEIEKRHSVVAALTENRELLSSLMELLGGIGDMERIISRAAAGRVNPREIVQLKKGLEAIPRVKKLVAEAKFPDENELQILADSLVFCTDLQNYLSQRLLPEPAAQLGKGDIIASGVDSELDYLRELAHNGKKVLEQIQERESERTGIPSLKISYNNVFGYYLEVRNLHKDKVPQEWIRKQTLVNAERYITQELKEYEEKILGAQEKIYVIEQRLYTELVLEIQRAIPQIQANAALIAKLDCLLSFAQCAIDYKYVRPTMNDGLKIDIKQGRHPVIERLMPDGEEYVSNDLFLDNSSQQIIILTGPNMSGKSALLRQTALIVLMAQIGSFVPATSATIGYVDKLFTRVGASDNISRGESTFMVEMLETSTILHNVSERSLVLLDEIGRGTSTYDGMSIAWAIVEYLHEHSFGAKTLFATHYHELNDLENKYNRVKNFHISVKEINGKVLFLRKLTLGGVAHSFGIHVAKLAGMPSQVVRSAEKILSQLEENSSGVEGKKGFTKIETIEEPVQLSFFQLEDPLLVSIRDSLKEMDLNSMSPLDAFDLLRDLKKRTGLK